MKVSCLRIRAGGLLPIDIAPEHPILISTMSTHNHKHKLSDLYWKEAQSITAKHTDKDGDYVVVPRITGNISLEMLDLTSFAHGRGRNLWNIKIRALPLNEEIAWLIGLYVAEGYSRGVNQGFGFCLSKDEATTLAKTTVAILTAFNLSSAIKPSQKSNGLNVESYNVLFGRALKSWCGGRAREKKIPDFILYHENKKILSAFLRGYEQGDGTISSDGGISRSTVSLMLAQQLQLGYARLGMLARLYTSDRRGEIKHIEGRQIHGELSYLINTTRSGGVQRSKTYETKILVPVRAIESMVDYRDSIDERYTYYDGHLLASNAIISSIA